MSDVPIIEHPSTVLEDAALDPHHIQEAFRLAAQARGVDKRPASDECTSPKTQEAADERSALTDKPASTDPRRYRRLEELFSATAQALSLPTFRETHAAGRQQTAGSQIGLPALSTPSRVHRHPSTQSEHTGAHDA